jgi:hypothetical protein
MKMFGNSVNVQSELFNLMLLYGFPSFLFIRLTMWKEGLQLYKLLLCTIDKYYSKCFIAIITKKRFKWTYDFTSDTQICNYRTWSAGYMKPNVAVCWLHACFLLARLNYKWRETETEGGFGPF